MPFEMDDWRVDVAVAGSQKGLMTPPVASAAAGRRRSRSTARPGCAPAIGTGPSARARSTTRNTAARRRSISCSACAGAGPAVRGGPRDGVPAPSPAGRGGPPRGCHVGGRRDPGVQHRGAFGARRSVTTVLLAGAQDPSSLLEFCARNAASCWASGSARCTARRFASRTWATSTRR